MRAVLELGRRGAEIFEYGNGLRAAARDAGVADAFEMGGFVERYIRPLFCRGVGPFRRIALSGDPRDIHTIDDLILEHFQGNPVTDWIAKARANVPFTGLPARIGWLGHGQHARLALLVNAAVADGRVSAPVSFTRDHLDAGSVAAPYRETERMRDGSDAIADWPLLTALLTCASHADLVAIHGHMGALQSAGVTLVAADGSAQAAAAEPRPDQRHRPGGAAPCRRRLRDGPADRARGWVRAGPVVPSPRYTPRQPDQISRSDLIGAPCVQYLRDLRQSFICYGRCRVCRRRSRGAPRGVGDLAEHRREHPRFLIGDKGGEVAVDAPRVHRPCAAQRPRARVGQDHDRTAPVRRTALAHE